MECGPSGRFVRELLAANPCAAKVKDADGRLPLHLAAEHQVSFEVVQMLFGAHPGAVTLKYQITTSTNVRNEIRHASCTTNGTTDDSIEHFKALLATTFRVPCEKARAGRRTIPKGLGRLSSVVRW